MNNIIKWRWINGEYTSNKQEQESYKINLVYSKSKTYEKKQIREEE